MPKLYPATATSLLPSAMSAGYDRIASQSAKPLAAHPKPGLRSSATRQYRSTDPVLGVEILGAMVFRSEAQARAQYASVCTHGCDAMKFNGWSFKRRSEVEPATSDKAVTLVALCRNVVLGAIRVASDNADHITRQLRGTLDAVFAKAYSSGMTPCGSAATPLPRTGTYYWSESQADTFVVKLVRIPYCDAFANDSGCSGEAPLRLQSADCRGVDERGSTFTYSRFECDVVVYGGYARGRIAVFPTGPASLRWKLL
ncbi:MAG TPA: hypothetical protein VFA19_07105 [Gaiellaceae bacterium]|nr:hypothetical protein [Gaiellaceae bacterium]